MNQPKTDQPKDQSNRAKKMWCKLEALMKNGENIVVDPVDYVPPPQTLDDGVCVYYVGGERRELKDYSQLSISVVWDCNEATCGHPQCVAKRKSLDEKSS